MQKPSIKTITIKSLINVLLVLAILLLLATAYHFRQLSTQNLKHQALAHAELVKAGLTAHMKSGIMDKRDYFLQEIQQLHEVKSLRVIRSPEVTRQFGPGRPWEQPDEPVHQQLLSSHEPIYQINEFTLQPTIRVLIPYIASRNHSLNCMGCHTVSEGTVLGGVDVVLDVSEERNYAILGLLGLLLLSILAFLLIYINTSRTIRFHIQQPLEKLVDSAMHAYHQRQPLELEHFETQEFSNVADEFNLFNSEIIAHQEMLKQKNEELKALNNEIESTLRETVYTMGVIEEKRSKETGNHTRRVSMYCNLLAQLAGLSQNDIDLVTAASPLHDIGKLGIPDNILHKAGKLDDEERKIMMNHPNIGFQMLKHSQRNTLVAARIIAHQHHEKWDGSGYPQGLSGQQIHLYARIVALADVFDALFSPRVYKSAWSAERVATYIRDASGLHFDPELAEIFLQHLDEFIKIYEKYPADTEQELEEN